MSCIEHKGGIDASLLFFFLILVLIFCNPGILNFCCDDRGGGREDERCMPACDC